MKRICVIVPTEDYMKSAGVRIRYQRIASHLEPLGWSLTCQVIDTMHTPDTALYDVYLFSKCYDAKSFSLAQSLADLGKRVGIDFFDDYFSQGNDSRLISHRVWLETMAPLVDYYLCSTPRMGEVASGYLPAAQGHILQDPFDQCDPVDVGRIADRHLQRLRSTGRLDVAWFGVGDNPYFPVGLSDVVGFGDWLSRLGETGLDVRLRIATNRRPLTAAGLEMLKRLPVDFELEEWTAEGEAALLSESAVAFIPVNAQRFSVAKSLNRAMSALSAGAQVLSTGYPLYERLGDFIYRDPDRLLNDLQNGLPALNIHSAFELPKLFSETGSLAREAIQLVAFMDELTSKERPQQDAHTVMLVHGRRSSAASHKFAQKLEHFSVQGPLFYSPNLNYDIRLLTDDAHVTHIEMNDRALRSLKPEFAALARRSVNSLGKAVVVLGLVDLQRTHDLEPIPLDHKAQLSSVVSLYDHIMERMVSALNVLFENAAVFVSEVDTPLFARSILPRAEATQ